MPKKTEMPILLLLLLLGLLVMRKAVAEPRAKMDPKIVSRVLGYSDLIKKYAGAEGVDPALVAAVIHWESGGNPEAVERRNTAPISYGLMQIRYETALDMGMPSVLEPSDLLFARTNITYGTKYLKWLLTRYRGDLQKTLSAYNQGPGNLDRYGITNWKYVNGVTALYQQYKALI